MACHFLISFHSQDINYDKIKINKLMISFQNKKFILEIYIYVWNPLRFKDNYLI